MLAVVIYGVGLAVNSFSSPGTDTFSQAPVQSEPDYKASATSTTAAALDKNRHRGLLCSRGWTLRVQDDQGVG